MALQRVRIAALLAALALVATLMVSMTATPAWATSVNVSDATGFFEAIDDLSTDHTGPHEIVLTSNIELTGELTPVYLGSQDLTIRSAEGFTYTITQAIDADASVLIFAPSEAATLWVEDIIIFGFDTTGPGYPLFASEAPDSDVAVAMEFHNVTFDGNVGYEGTAIYSDGPLTIVDSTFIDNHAEASGIVFVEGDLEITSSVFQDNTSEIPVIVAVIGGDFFGDSDLMATAVVSDVEFTNNTGGITGLAVDIHVEDSFFTSNDGTGGEAIIAPFGVFGTGAALNLFYSRVVIDNTDFTDNTGGSLGAAVAGVLAAVKVTESRFEGNGIVYDADMCDPESEDAEGGVPCGGADVAIVLGGLQIHDSEFSASNANVNSDECASLDDTPFGLGEFGGLPQCMGGSLLAMGVLFDIQNSLFEYGYATAGGAMALVSSVGRVATSTLTDNQADVGGAIFSIESNVQVFDSSLVGNEAEEVGAILTAGGEPEFLFFDPEFFEAEEESDNPLDQAFNAIVDELIAYPPSMSLEVNNTTLFDNSDGLEAGAVLTVQATVALNHVTAVQNESEFGGMFSFIDSDVEIFGSLLTHDSTTPVCNASDTVVSLGYNVVFEDSCFVGLPTDKVDEDGAAAYLDLDLVDHEGKTHFSPLPGNPMIDAIPADQCHETVVTDARGMGRPHDGNNDSVFGCDIGAVEVPGDFMRLILMTSRGEVVIRVYGATRLEGRTYTVGELGGTAPADTHFPFGAVGFVAWVLNPGDSVDVEIDIPVPVETWWKNDGSSWFELESALIDELLVTYTLTDGELGDIDGDANAVIVDPVAGGIGVLATG